MVNCKENQAQGDTMNDNKPTTSIRLPVDLKAKLQAESEKQGRTLSNLIIYILKQYVDQLDKESP
jgi:predicted DNA-binding protein